MLRSSGGMVEMGKYVLRCLECGLRVADAYTNKCPRGHDGLLRSEYSCELSVRKLGGIWKFWDWLPSTEKPFVNSDAMPATYKSEGLARELRLRNLYVSFNGFWPERGAFVETCTFKEYEAIATFQRAYETTSRILVVASAGNTARGFAQVSASCGMPVVCVVPEKALRRLWATKEPSHVVLVAVKGDYPDAIRVAASICDACPHLFVSEGGFRNVARRDALGVVLLDAVFRMHVFPTHYFQAVGSGTGAIGVFEQATRLLNESKNMRGMPRLHLAQNLPFAPMFRAWKARRSKIIPEDTADAEIRIRQMYADVLSNKNPPYALKGGVYEILRATHGEMYGITNEEAKSAQKLFESVEGIDIDPAAAVAVAALIQAVERGVIRKEDTVLLNISGGGYKRLNESHLTCLLSKMDATIRALEIEEIVKELQECIKAAHPTGNGGR